MSNQVVEVKKTQMQVVQDTTSKMLEQVKNFDKEFTKKDETFAVDTIVAVNTALVTKQMKWTNIDVVGCALPIQIKRWAKLGVSINEDKLYIDIRANKNKSLQDVFIKPQYQTLEKIMIKFCTKEIVRFKHDTICVGDDFEVETDFETGLDKVVKHTKDKSINREDLKNIIGAYKIAYIKEDGVLNQYLVQIDKSRIDVAYNASPSREKTVWKASSTKMVLKTVTWEMYNNANIRAYMLFPEDLLDDVKVIEESQEMNWNNNETKLDSVIEVKEEVIEAVATEEVPNFDSNFDNYIDVSDNGEVQE
ncbi:MAG: hypothetical protein R3Y05_01450 [bacterium]